LSCYFAWGKSGEIGKAFMVKFAETSDFKAGRSDFFYRYYEEPKDFIMAMLSFLYL